jgi:hypothetical protein
MAGHPVSAYLYCNANRGCWSLDWDDGFDPDPAFTLTLCNDWNRSYRFAKAYIRKDGAFFIEYSVQFNGGITREAIAQSANRFGHLLSDFDDFMKKERAQH